MKQLIEDILTKAMINFKNDGFLAPMAFLVQDDKIFVHPIRYASSPDDITDTPPTSYELADKDTFFVYLGMLCKKHNASKVILLQDVALRMMNNMTHEQQQYVHQNMETESPLTYPEGSPYRQEAILVQLYNFNDDTPVLALQAYRMVKDKIVFGDRLDKMLPEGVQFDGLIKDRLTEGYNMDPANFTSNLDFQDK